MEIRHVRTDEFFALRDLLDTVFTQHNGHEADFSRLFPRLFGEKNDYVTASHLGAFENGRLIGTAAMYPSIYRVGGVNIRLIANGNVAVAQDCRGRGVMSAILTEINRECDKTGDLGYLHGDPVRYGRFGYVPCGKEYLLRFAPAPGPFRFVPFEADDAPRYLALLRQKTDYIVRREEEVLPSLRAGYREALSVYDENGAFVGGFSFNRAANAVEEFAVAPGREEAIFRALAHAQRADVTVRLSGYEQALADRLHADAREEKIPALFRVIRPNVLRDAARAAGVAEDMIFAPYLS